MGLDLIAKGHAVGSVRAYYDGSCARCRRLATWAKRQDSTHLITWHSLSKVSEDAKVDSLRAQTEIPVLDESGRLYYGFEGIRQIVARLPKRPTKWLRLGIALIAWLKLGQPLYRWISRSR